MLGADGSSESLDARQVVFLNTLENSLVRCATFKKFGESSPKIAH